jgi:hypothetical protein
VVDRQQPLASSRSGPRGPRPSRSTALAAALAALAALVLPAAALAQASAGVPLRPDQNLYLAGGYDLGMKDDYDGLGGRVGMRLGDESRHLLGLGFFRGRVNQNGSHSYSYSLRYAYEAFDDGDGIGASGSFVLGLTRGYSWIFNVDGKHYNGHLTATYLPLGAGLAHTVGWGGVRLSPWILPQLSLVSRHLELYDRRDSVEFEELDYHFAVAFGANATLYGRVFAGFEFYTKLTDLDALTTSFSLGLLF